MPVPDEIKSLVDRFHRNRDSYSLQSYNETQVRREFIDPFFKALGWDVDNEKGYAEAYKDVIHEPSLKIGESTKAPDYCFRIGGQRKFFLEAKKPFVNIKSSEHPAFQLRRYAWSAKLPLSILTDFEEFAVYECGRIRPAKNDAASKARILYYKYTDYEEKWDEIAGIFHRDSILKGSFDRFIESTKKKRGTAEVDDAFLEEMDQWREILAKHIALRNRGLTERDLNHAVQVTIDRIIFLRICEDRGVEPYGQLNKILDGKNLYSRLVDLYKKADQRYNSGLFHFRKETGRPEPDSLTPNLILDDTILKNLLKGLYYPDSPYEFSVIPADILGHVYERFLGKVIRLTKGGRAKIEEKPEVRKAGGVYYTPTYIVDYIVGNTVGKMLEKKTPRSAAKLRILDPACGSGSFLIGAYQYLLDWRLKYYENHNPEKLAKKTTPPIYQASGGDWKLTTSERKKILLNNIYGVDIDSQAVEVTKLTLLLKVLEGESAENIDALLRLFHDRALPDLGNNIKCGNSLIGPDFYDNAQMTFLDEEERYRINVFDWHSEFPEIFKRKNPGFDAVIGNPPYGFHLIHAKNIKPYLRQEFTSAKGGFEHYFLFYERSLRLLNNGGHHGFIVPVTWLTIPSAYALRSLILSNYRIKKIAWLSELVFKDAQVNTLISIIERSKPEKVEIEIYSDLGFQSPPSEKRVYDQTAFIDADFYMAIFEGGRDTAVIEKIVARSKPLQEFARPCSGYNPYEVGKGEKPQGGAHTKETVRSKPYHSKVRLGDEWKPEIAGRDLRRYSLTITGYRWIKYGPWLAAPRDPQNFAGKRILVQEIVGGPERRIVAVFCDRELYYSRDVIPIKIEKESPDPYYLLGLINSQLLTWYHQKRNPKAKKQLFPKVLVSDLRKLPIQTIDFTNPTDKALHDRMVDLVEHMLDLHKRLNDAKNPHDKETLQRQIAATDIQIDRLVYELYDLTEEEIRIVEGSK